MTGVLDRLLRLGCLQCPRCHGGVRASATAVMCDDCGARYAIRDGVPLFSLDAIASKGVATSPEKSTLRELRERFPVLARVPRLLMLPRWSAPRAGRTACATSWTPSPVTRTR